ncbi:hypothetical protein TNCV_1755591 [Trichonephila clavipes]|nr:hypothetical protein TNCV_1755591 [Trichonephila clavipes]
MRQSFWCLPILFLSPGNRRQNRSTFKSFSFVYWSEKNPPDTILINAKWRRGLAQTFHPVASSRPVFLSPGNITLPDHIEMKGGADESRGIKKAASRLNNTRSFLECSQWRSNYVRDNVMVVTHFSSTRSGSVEWWE